MTLTADEKYRVASVIAYTIRELGSIPSGHLYALLMGDMSLDTYNGLIDLLKRTHMVAEKNHMLTWIGPRAGAQVSGKVAQVSGKVVANG
jgi:hypothetical protein